MEKIKTFIVKIVTSEYFYLGLIVFVGLIVRLYKINNPVADWHSWRQADTASVTREYVKSGINLLYPTYHDISSIQTGIFNPEGFRMVEFPIYNAIHTILFNSIGKFSLEIWGRIVSIVASLFSAILLFLIAKKFYSKSVALFSALFFLILPFNIYFSRVILPEPVGVLFALFGIYFFTEHHEKDQIIKLILSAVFFALALLIKPFFVFYFVPLVYLAYLKKDRFRKYILFFIIAFTPLLVWRWWISHFPEGIPFYTWAFNGDLIRFHPAFWRWLIGERMGILILGAWGLIPFSFGLSSKIKSKFALWFLLGMFLYVSVVATASVRHDYYQILTIPSISLVLAIGTERLWKLNKLLLIMSILVMFLISWDRVKPFYVVNHPELMEVGKIVDTTLPKDALVVAPYNGDTAFLYQTNRSGWPAVDTSIDQIIERGADYYISVDLHSADTINFEKQFKTITKTEKYIILDLHKKL